MKTILVVEDSESDFEVLNKYLQQTGFSLNVMRVKSVEEGKEKLEKIKPNLIILDVILPGKSGFEFCKEIKSNDNTKAIPVIISSSKGTNVDITWGTMLGANAYLPKPLDGLQLTKTIKDLLKI